MTMMMMMMMMIRWLEEVVNDDDDDDDDDGECSTISGSQSDGLKQTNSYHNRRSFPRVGFSLWLRRQRLASPAVPVCVCVCVCVCVFVCDKGDVDERRQPSFEDAASCC